jgi:lysophospholipid acyltransferase (LPLAT)-like uncharacterized protein
MKALLRHPATQAVLVWLGGLYLIFALRTTRWVLDGPEHLAQATAGHATVAAFWHERLALMPMLWLTLRRQDPAQRGHVLVSQHRDGRLIGAVMRRFGVDAVYGSSRRGGASGVRTALPLLARGDHLVMTPDGPRGPRRVAAPGVAQIAACGPGTAWWFLCRSAAVCWYVCRRSWWPTRAGRPRCRGLRRP